MRTACETWIAVWVDSQALFCVSGARWSWSTPATKRQTKSWCNDQCAGRKKRSLKKTGEVFWGAALQPKRTIYDNVRLLWYRIMWDYDFTRHSTTVFLKNFKTSKATRCLLGQEPAAASEAAPEAEAPWSDEEVTFAAWKIRRSAGVGQRSRNDSIVVRRASDWSGRTWKAVKILTLAPRNKTSRGTWSGLAAVTESPIAISWHIWHGNTLYNLNDVCFQKTVFAAHYGFRFWRSPRLCQCSCIWLADPSLAA